MDPGFDDEAATSTKKPVDKIHAQDAKDDLKIERHKNWIMQHKGTVKFWFVEAEKSTQAGGETLDAQLGQSVQGKYTKTRTGVFSKGSSRGAW